MAPRSLIKACISCALILSIGCTKEDTGGSDEATTDTGSSTSEFRTSCGTVFNGVLENPVSAKSGTRGTLRYIGPNLVSIALKSGDQLIKLHGLDVPYEDYKRSGAQSVMEKLIAEGDGYLFMAEPECAVTLDDGGEGVIGHVFSATGKSFTEALLKSGYADPGYDSCGGSLVSSCYRALEEETSAEIAGEVTEFLWKPVSDSNGKLAVHSSPYGTTIRVNGEVGANQGGGNGYGSLARFNKPGCSYGGNVRVEVLDENGAAYLYKGEKFITIPDGCQRWKLKNGTISPDKK